MLDKIDSRIKEFASVFINANFELYLVGGAVRDLLMEKKPKDWDLTTSATPEEVMKIFPKVIPTGVKHGTVTVLYKGMSLEVTSYRSDGDYQDHRKPKTVSFTRNLEKDLERRDFTINAIALDPLGGNLIDLHGGRQDMKSKIIRCIGDATLRFDEDALRILRALRFQSQLGFTIEEQTQQAMKNHSQLMKHLSIERIRDELWKLLGGQFCHLSLGQLSDYFSNHQLWPGWKAPHDKNPWVQMIQRLSITDPLLRFYGFLIGSRDFPSVGDLRKAKLSNQQINWINCLTQLLCFPWSQGSQRFQRVHFAQSFLELGLDPNLDRQNYNQLLAYLGLDSPKDSDWLECFENLPSVKKVNELEINGEDLMAIGIPKTKELGDLLKRLLLAVWDGSIKNDKNELLEAAKESAQLQIYPPKVTDLW